MTFIDSGKKHLVTHIQHFSVNDGPGIRTTVFLKGCPLNCAWCHNPENIHTYQEFFYYEEKCVKCGACAENCPEKAIIPPRIRYKEDIAQIVRFGGGDGSIPTNLQHNLPNTTALSDEKEIEAIDPPRIDREKCTSCMTCVDVCHHEALNFVSTLKSVEEIFEEVLKDDLFFKSSGGGFTVSGGEPLMHPDMTLSLVKRAKKEGLNTVLDTCGFANWNTTRPILEHVDLIMLDIKSLDDQKHKKWTGVSNRLILENARKMAETGIKMRLRLPIIHSVNFWDLQYPKDIVKFARTLGKNIIGIDLLPFHNFASKKCGNLGRKGYFDNFPNIFREEIEDYRKIISDGGTWQTTIGGLIGVS
ncbi:MAG: glycyl-radical enzyme activating protein [Desulfotignum sp.]|nr:glycyl-radical enzyme activating protein [Desulfotignum sp.]MCF8090802.1 glycyl-radical enzyme activating protein [Desulfotignum sp.]MCF8137491.1 glycyl-radical enzyme activating protein [Desulfotignum sp.]